MSQVARCPVQGTLDVQSLPSPGPGLGLVVITCNHWHPHTAMFNIEIVRGGREGQNALWINRGLKLEVLRET